MFSLKKELFVIYGRRRLPGKIGVIEYKTNNDNNGQNIFAVSVTQESHQYDEQYGHERDENRYAISADEQLKVELYIL